MIRPPLFAALVLVNIMLACAEKPGQQAVTDTANLLLLNARVYTMNWQDAAPDGSLTPGAPHDDSGWHPDAEAIVVDGNTIAFVGSSEDALNYKNEQSRVVDLAGATVIPGLVDSHTHVFELGKRIDSVSLVDAKTEADAVALIVERAKTIPDGEWIIGLGWDEGAWADDYPDKLLLSEAVPNHPVLMHGLHGFADWCNQTALDVTGTTADTPVPVGGELRLGEDGQPSGLFINRAVEIVRNAMPELSDEEMRRQLQLGLKRMAEDGYVAVHDAGLASREMEILQQLEDEGALPLRVYAMLSLRDEDLMRHWIARGPDDDADSMLVTRTVKAYYDGALGSRGARLLYDYSDMPGHRGISGDSYGFNETLMAEAMRAGFQIAIHAIGDAGNREALDILERIIDGSPATGTLRHRIEHAQVLHPDDLPRIGALGFIASMEPPHAMEDKAWAEKRLGPERILGAYAWRSLRETNAALTFNSDNPGSDHNIFYGLHSAIARKDKNQQPEGGWYVHEAVNAEEAIRAYTHWSAYASFREDETGIIESGRWADLTVMDVDPFVLADDSPGDLLSGRILMTIVNGDIVYER
ncbi:MAG: amidohydrolase [Gammaproteobacteria bacterium]|nr:amidohydrolase [Gammaproteobacteria bacterium]